MRTIAAAIACVATLGMPTAAQSQTTWSGTGANANWETANNWSTILSNNFNTGLVFAGSNLLSNTNTLTGGTATGITFSADAGAFVIGGNAISLSGNVTNSSANTQTLGLNMALTADSIFSGSSSTTLAGTFTQSGTSRTLTNNLAPNSTLTLGAINLSANATGYTLTVAGTGNTKLSGVISNGTTAGVTAGGITITGTGTTTLSAANTYTGVTTITGGSGVVLEVSALTNYGVAGPLGARASASDVVGSIGLLFRGGTLRYSGSTAQSTNRAIRVSVFGGAGATFDASGSLPEATMSFTATSSPNFLESGGARTLTFTGSNTGANTFAMAIGEASGATSVVKSGPGRWVLSGSSTYTGVTTISGGRLDIASGGQINGTSGITINGSGAEFKYNSATPLTKPITFTQGTLSGTGTIGTAVTAGANDILAPGNSPGAQSFTSGLTWGPAGTYLWEINDATGGNGTGWDIINVSGGSGLTINATSGTTFRIAITSLSGTAAGNATNFSATTSGSWTILSSSSISGFAANKFNLDRSAFTNTSSGSFTLSQVASGTNQTLVLAYNTISALSSSTSSVTGFRVMQGQSTTTAVNLLNAGPDATGYSLSPSGGLSLVSGSNGTLAGSGTQAITFGFANTGTTGARSGTVSFTNTGNSGDTPGSVTVSGAVVANRVVTASAVDFGLVHLGASGTATSAFTSTGSDNDFTRITVGNGTGGGLTVSGSSGFEFNGSGGSSRTVAGTFATAGVVSGTISLANASAETGGTLSGQIPGTTGLAYSASVFSGTATWNIAGGGSWDTQASGTSWTSTGDVKAAPGTFTGYANTDKAIFAGTQGGTSTVLLNSAAPSLAAISFTNTTGRYVIDQGSGGSLTLAASSGKPTIDIAAGGLHEIKTAILGSGGLSKIGAGTLVLSGSSSFTGGTDVTAGTLAINGSLGSAVNVASGAILGGTGALNGLVNVVGGGILAPGNSPGTLTMNAGLVLADASLLSFELSATDFTVGGGINDLINVNGTFTLDGILNVTGIGDFSTVANNTKWRLFNYAGGTFTNNGLSLGTMPSVGASGKYFQIDTATAGQVNLVIVPEPAAIAIAGIGVALAAWSLRRGRTDAA